MILKNTTYIIIILGIATFLTSIGTYFAYTNSVQAVDDSLKLQSLGIAISLEPSLSKLNPDKNIFRDIVTEGTWEGIAFLALYDEKGITLLHSNENLINKKTDDEFLKKALSGEEAVYDYKTLGTGERIFTLNFPFQVNNETRVLRVGLHTYPFENIARQARFQGISAFVVILILWIMGYFFIRAIKQTEALHSAIEEKNRLAMLGEMSSVLAHEIRNPLGSIKGFAQLIMEQEKNKKTYGETNEHLNIIIAESKRLEALTDELLLYSRISDYKPEEFELGNLIDESIKNISANLNSGHVDFKVTAPEKLHLKTDYNKLKQILINIMQNSVESLAEKGFVEVIAEDRNKYAEISVRDNGCGMDKETLSNAFKPFFTTKTRGTGLGLAIVERLVKSLEGQIELKSEPKKGTDFKIIIPKQL
jgi:two-component system sensor histidine kinase HydH